MTTLFPSGNIEELYTPSGFISTQENENLTKQNIFNTMAKEAKIDSPLGAIFRQVDQSYAASKGMWQNSELYQPEQATELYSQYGLSFSKPVTKVEADYLAKQKIKEFNAREALAKGSGDLASGIVSFAGAMFGAMTDPINLASSVIPITRAFPAMKALHNTGTAFQKMQLSFIDAAIGNAIVEPMAISAAIMDQRDYTLTDSMTNVFIGGLIGTTLTGLGEGVKYVSKKAKFDIGAVALKEYSNSEVPTAKDSLTDNSPIATKYTFEELISMSDDVLDVTSDEGTISIKLKDENPLGEVIGIGNDLAEAKTDLRQQIGIALDDNIIMKGYDPLTVLTKVEAAFISKFPDLQIEDISRILDTLKEKKTLSTVDETIPIIELPQELRKSKPRYSDLELQFENYDDMALYIVRNKKNLSKSDFKFMEHLRKVFPNKTDVEIRKMGDIVLDKVKTSKTGLITPLFKQKIKTIKKEIVIKQPRNVLDFIYKETDGLKNLDTYLDGLKVKPGARIATTEKRIIKSLEDQIEVRLKEAQGKRQTRNLLLQQEKKNLKAVLRKEEKLLTSEKGRDLRTKQLTESKAKAVKDLPRLLEEETRVANEIQTKQKQLDKTNKIVRSNELKTDIDRLNRSLDATKSKINRTKSLSTLNVEKSIELELNRTRSLKNTHDRLQEDIRNTEDLRKLAESKHDPEHELKDQQSLDELNNYETQIKEVDIDVTTTEISKTTDNIKTQIAKIDKIIQKAEGKAEVTPVAKPGLKVEITPEENIYSKLGAQLEEELNGINKEYDVNKKMEKNYKEFLNCKETEGF